MLVRNTRRVHVHQAHFTTAIYLARFLKNTRSEIHIFNFDTDTSFDACGLPVTLLKVTEPPIARVCFEKVAPGGIPVNANPASTIDSTRQNDRTQCPEHSHEIKFENSTEPASAENQKTR